MHLGDFIELKRGYDLPKKQRTAGSVPLVSSAGISDYHSEAKVCGPGVVTGRYGTIGEVFYVEEDFWPLNTTLYVRDFKGNDPRFTYYFLKTIDYLQYSDKAAVPGVNRNHLHTAEISVPESVTEQRRIASVLSALDDKIQLNHQINQTLEQMAQAIFKSWFVDFEPVKAKIAARERWHALQPGNDPASPVCYAGELDGQPIDVDLDTYMNLAAMQAISGKDADQLAQMQAEKPEQYAKLYATAELFPSAMQDSELGEIPEGWQCLSLDAIANYQNGLALQKYRPESEDDYLPVVKIAQLKKGFADGLEKASPNIKPECIIDNGDVVFSWSGSLMVDTWCGGKAALNQHLFKVTSKSYPKWLYYFFTKHHLDEFQRIAAAKAVTMGHIKREHLKSALCAIPCEGLIKLGTMAIGSLIDKQIEGRLESKNLAQLRDTLLPKLLSGELKLPDIEEPQTECQDVAHG